MSAAVPLEVPDALGFAATQALDAWRSRVRGSINGFVEGVMKDHLGNPVFQAPLHRVMHLHFEHCWKAGMYPALLAPFDTGKTVQLVVGRVAYELGHDVTLRCKIICATDEKATERAMGVKQILFSPGYRLAFPNVRLVSPEKARREGKQSKSTQHEIFLDRPGHAIDPSVHAAGVTTSGTGGRADLMLFDDVVDQGNAIDKPEMRRKVIDQFESVWIQRLEPEARAGFVGTAWHQADLTHTLMDRPGWCMLSIAVSEDFERLDMQVWNPPDDYPLPRKDRGKHGQPRREGNGARAWVDLPSSNLEAVRWAAGDLEVRFKGGGHYRYEQVPKDVFEALVRSDSPGGYFGAWIKNAYQTSRVS